jgi:CBS-domain-containing membrane protein
MHDRKLGRLPVTEEDEILVGISTRSDLVGLVARLLQERAANQVSGSHAIGLPPRAVLGHSNTK